MSFSTVFPDFYFIKSQIQKKVGKKTKKKSKPLKKKIFAKKIMKTFADILKTKT